MHSVGICGSDVHLAERGHWGLILYTTGQNWSWAWSSSWRRWVL